MKKFKAGYITSGIFSCMIIGFMFSAVLAVCIHAGKKIDDMLNSTEDKQEIKIDLEAMYPFETGDMKSKRKETIFEKMYDKLKEKCDEYSSSKLIGYYSIIESAKGYENAAGWNMASVFDYNAVVKLRDGHLTTYMPSNDITANAKATIELAEFCRAKGIKFFYVNAPTKICAIEDKNISGVLDFKNQNTDRFLEMIGASGVRYYDLRKNLHEEGMNHHKSFYITDNHWRVETALWAARHILNFLRDDYGLNVKPEMLDPDKFNFDVYHEWFLGGHGTKATLAGTKPEDFTFVYPKYTASITVYEPYINGYTSGDFFVMCNMEELQEKDYYGRHTYNRMYKSHECFHIKNNLVSTGKKILMLRDSFATGLLPFMILGTQSIDAIDLRLFPGSLKSYMKANPPDILIIMYCTDMPGISSMLKVSDSQKRLYDFR